MELTSKQRAQLRGIAAGEDTIIHIGKDGISENLIKQVNDALEARELVKGRVLENSMYTALDHLVGFVLVRVEIGRESKDFRRIDTVVMLEHRHSHFHRVALFAVP